MGEKTRRTISIDSELNRKLAQRDEINVSGLVNELLWNYVSGANKDEAAIEAMIDQQRQLVQEKQQQAQQAESRLQELQQRKEEIKEAGGSDSTDGLTTALEALEGTPPDPDNPAVKNWSRKLEMRPTELVAKMEQQ